MNAYANQLKELIHSLISEIAASPGDFTTSHPDAFTRKGKWGIPSIMSFILTLGGKSLGCEIGDFFHYRKGFPTVSSFVQQRKKLAYTAFELIFQKFNARCRPLHKLIKGYRLLAIDGCTIPLPYNPQEPNCIEGKHISKMHLNGLFDLLGKVYVDALVERGLEMDETASGCTIVDRLSDRLPAIIVADRNYESYNFFAHIEERGFDYVVRVKDVESTGILAGMALPKQGTFDITAQIFIESSHSLRAKLLPHKYKYIAKKKRFDYRHMEKDGGYEMLIRLVRVRLEGGAYECLATSLPEEVFSAEDLKEIYRRRWGIETAFRELKHVVGISAFHSKQENSILQEIYARLTIYNYSMLIAGRVQIKERNLKNRLQVNYTQAIRICQHYFKCPGFGEYDVEATIQRFLLPVRPNRNYNRNPSKPNIKSFNYRLT